MADNDRIEEDLRDIRNDIEQIKSDTGTINRILVMTNANIIIEDFLEIIGSNNRRSMILHILNERKSVNEIAEIMNIKRTQVYSYLNPFLRKGYVYRKKEGRVAYYIRAEILDKLNYDEIEGIKELIEKWKEENPNE